MAVTCLILSRLEEPACSQAWTSVAQAYKDKKRSELETCMMISVEMETRQLRGTTDLQPNKEGKTFIILETRSTATKWK